MALEKETATYKAKLTELAPHEGKFVLIPGDEVVDTFGTYEDAMKEGYAKFGLTPFLVKQVHAYEQSSSFHDSFQSNAILHSSSSTKRESF